MSYLWKEKLDEEGEEMKEYIEREVITDILFRYSQVASEPPMDMEDAAILKELHQISDEIKNTPTADVEPVRYGEWVYECGETTWGNILLYEHCSLCGWKEQRLEDRLSLNYCPNCGARMDGGKK